MGAPVTCGDLEANSEGMKRDGLGIRDVRAGRVAPVRTGEGCPAAPFGIVGPIRAARWGRLGPAYRRAHRPERGPKAARSGAPRRPSCPPPPAG